MSAPLAPWRLGLVGVGGHMGRRVLSLLENAGGLWPGCGGRALRLAATLGRAPVPPVADAPGYTADAEAFAGAVDVAVDFSAPAAAGGLAPVLAGHGVGYVVASTDLTAAAEAALAAAAAAVPVLVAANTSLGVWVLAELVQRAAAAWPSADVEVVELHHRRKRDAPSGTALLLGAAARAGWQQAEGAGHGQGRVGADVCGRTPSHPPRQPKELGYSAVRGGDVVGEHTVYLLADGERLELSHRCSNADTFARGALQAAAWLVGRSAGRYAFADVLGHRGG